jgi:transcriptional regulator with XRE-family HTH domain
MPRGHKKRSRHLPDKLKQIRESLSLSQDGMLAKLGLEEDLERSYISAYEVGRLEPPLETLLKYAEIANVCVEILIRDDATLPRDLPCRTLYHQHKR